VCKDSEVDVRCSGCEDSDVAQNRSIGWLIIVAVMNSSELSQLVG
jgi:hypothetical protein